jgi:hypothetical protein
MPLRPIALKWGMLPTLALALVCAFALPAAAQPKKKGGAPPAAPPAADKADKAEPKAEAPDTKPGEKKKSPKEKTFDFNALDLNGRMRTPQLLYFLERANEELERASLEKRSFIPHMVRSVEEEQL